MPLSLKEKLRIITARVMLIILAPLHAFIKSRIEKSSFTRPSWDPVARQRQMYVTLGIVISVVGVSWAGASITGNFIESKNTIQSLTDELETTREQTSSQLSIAESNVAQCNSNLITCSGDLSVAKNNFEICKIDLTTKNTDLNSCIADRDGKQDEINKLKSERDGLRSLEADSARRLCGCPVPGNGESRSYNVTDNKIVCTNSGTKTVTC